MHNKALLLILDGWGVRESCPGNAISVAGTPNLDKLFDKYPSTTLACHGKPVGLPEGIMGNSEVGHLNLGAGRVVYQDIVRIDASIEDGSFFENPALCDIADKVAENGCDLHLAGLVSDGGVHSHMNHLYALLRLARQRGVSRTLVHAILDGRDTPPDSGKGYIRDLLDYMDEIGYGEIATITGRYWAMDRDKRWDRNRRAYRLWTEGVGEKARDPVAAVQSAYDRGETDEFVEPICLQADGKPLGLLTDGDGMVFFNFRADRARQITRAITERGFAEFDRPVVPELAGYVCMTRYDASFDLPVAFGPQKLVNILGEVISDLGLRQLRIAETEKYAHVTYFFSGGREEPFKYEDRLLVPSPREVPTYDHKPEMSAPEVADELVRLIREDNHDLLVCNFANMDMVGHTGILEAAVIAARTVDRCVGEVVAAAMEKGLAILICADHGNAECMAEESGKPHTAHTLNPVPCIVVDERFVGARMRTGRLGDVAPTILALMGLEKPAEMDGRNLLEE